MSEITQPPPDIPAQDANSRVNRLDAASDGSTSNNQSAQKQSGKNAAEVEPEKQISHHDPAVTLASTLAKLDSGSYFTATTSGHDGEGRTIITSELGTYLVEAEAKHAENLKKIQADTQLEIRVLTIDKEIRAEIIRPTIDENAVQKTTIIPVHLTLTDIGLRPAQNPAQPLPAAETPLDDIRSQYQATTLYKAERIAREIADKLDNLPLPTSSPNYTVYGSASADADKAANLSPRKVSANVFIQEVTSQTSAPQAAAPVTTPNTILEQILGQNINVQVIKAIPKTPVALPPGLPAAVIKEISTNTPLDYVKPGQNLNINIAAIAIPETGTKGAAQPSSNPAQPVTAPATADAAAATATSSSPKNITAPTVETTTVEAAQQPVRDAVISGIVIDTSQAGRAPDGKRPAPLASATPSETITTNPYSQKSSAPTAGRPQKESPDEGKNYYLATPTTVLKFQSNTPLIPGTIVSFTVTADNPAALQQPQSNVAAPAATAQATPSSGSQAGVAPATTTTAAPESVAGSVSPPLLDKIHQFVPQQLDQLPDDWGSISLALSALTSAAATNMAAILSSRIPNMQSPEQLTSTMFFFLSALKAPQPARAWLGPDVGSKLKQLGAGKLMDRIDHDFTRIARLGSEGPVGEWRPLLIPLQNGPDISAIPMLTRQIVDEDKNKNKDQQQEDDPKIKATRFILEIKFSQFGMMLIDGLLKGNRLDIILKSANAIPFAVKTKLSRQYSDALKNNDFDGELVIIDNSPTEVSVRKLLETMTHNAKFEKKI